MLVCEHSLGHTVPPTGPDLLGDFLLAHEYGLASPFADGELSALGTGCTPAASLP